MNKTKEQFVAKLKALPEEYSRWYSGDAIYGIMFTKKRIAWFIDFIEKYYPASLRIPHIFPYKNGNLGLEYVINKTTRIVLMVDFDVPYILMRIEEEDFNEIQKTRFCFHKTKHTPYDIKEITQLFDILTTYHNGGSVELVEEERN